ncbi:biotin/lipoyl-containing protein [Nocardioides bruguierae]|uniref:Acetyl-CoA carboxylase biotin carboxyl carrier protein subunit n=1 Tax=Nocardioides bruguierae TaxID=2945102 RepID=A0A9X2IG87_9ACTN|nr:biotin/lipoyl-containing protein [Nocardioides bruguierae]MCL8025757.1 acetyl-CoA carboxylase biotin carboxyl carrier protein subunit [Nocardioides bruguierae]MCM0622641.1 acetyl-CoA carboxylase biotin carboxyl carrier protein subunit [Nocardioides bruguierae]
MRLKVTVDGVAYDVEVEVEEEPTPTVGAVFMTGGSFAPAAAGAAPGGSTGPASSGGTGDGVKAPLAGAVARVLVEPGQEIAANDVLVVLEAMKMETEITAPAAGTVSAVLVAPGDTVSGGQVLVEMAEAQ